MIAALRRSCLVCGEIAARLSQFRNADSDHDANSIASLLPNVSNYSWMFQRPERRARCFCEPNNTPTEDVFRRDARTCDREVPRSVLALMLSTNDCRLSWAAPTASIVAHVHYLQPAGQISWQSNQRAQQNLYV
jgi:hypothetical protein